MKRLTLLLVTILCATMFIQAQQQKVAVVEFEVKGNVGIKDAGTIIAEWMSSGISKTGKFELYERILLKKVLEEQKLGVTGIISEDTASKMGEIYGVEALISGSIIEFQGIFSINARLIDTMTGKVMESADFKTRDSSAFASVMDKMAMVLAGDMSQESLDREGLNVAGNKSIHVPFSIIKVFEKNGQLIAAINRGINDNITKDIAFYIYMPQYEESQVTGQKTVVGKKKIGELIITQVEPDMCSGDLYVPASYKRDPGVIERDGIAVPFAMKIGMGLGATNLGFHVSLLLGAPKWSQYAEIGYTLPLFNFKTGLGVNAGFLYTLLGTTMSPINFKIGGDYLSFLYELSLADGSIIMGMTPLVELGLFRLVYVRGGALLGFDFMNDFRFVVVPILQAGVSIYF